MIVRHLPLTLMLAVLLVGPALAQPRMSEFDATIPTFDVSGPRTITESGIYRLTRDIEQIGTLGISIFAPEPIEVILDLNGFEIRGSVYIAGGEGRIRVMNGTIRPTRGFAIGNEARSLELLDVELFAGISDIGTPSAIELRIGEILRIQRSRIVADRCIFATSTEPWRFVADHNVFECGQEPFRLFGQAGGRIADNRIEIGPAAPQPLIWPSGGDTLFLRNTWNGEPGQRLVFVGDRYRFAGNRFAGASFFINGNETQFEDNEIDTGVWGVQPLYGLDIRGDDTKLRGNRIRTSPWMTGVLVTGDRTRILENEIAAIDNPALRIFGLDSLLRGNRFNRASQLPFPFLIPVIVVDPSSDLGDNLCNGEPCFP
ncbi:hypothetical protein ABI59_11420 [Acidobacteria bacterium Mor1]|nr:hypothetical protein ABI59_11420 [Acidobacteria bacterium Mor1]